VTARCAVFAFPGSLSRESGGYRYDRAVIAGLEALGWQITRLPLGEGFPLPDTAVLDGAVAALARLDAAQPVIVDGLALGALGDAAGRMKAPLIALVHHPLALEAGLDATVAERLRISEKAALAHADAIIVTGHRTVDDLARLFNIAPADVVVVPPGVSPVADPSPARAPGPPRLLAVGAIIPRKGYLDLIAALASLRERDWTLTLVGDDACDLEARAALVGAIGEAGLDGRVTLTGAVDDAGLARAFQAADIFVSASHYEGYGMAVAEAVAAGLFTVATRVGAAEDLVDPNAGLLVAPGDVPALTTALAVALDCADAQPARRSPAKPQPGWADAAAGFDRVLTACLAARRGGAS